MGSTYTTADLLADIKQEGMVPISQNTYSNQTILNLATNQLFSRVIPWMSSVREGYLIYPQDIPLVTGQTRYPIPTRASGISLDDVLLVQGTTERSVPEIPSSDRDRYSTNTNQGYGDRVAFYLQWNDLILTKDMSSRYTTLRVPYLIRPGDLAQTSDSAKVTAIDTGTGVVTVNTLPSDYTTALEYDFISGKGGYEYHAIDQTASALDSGAGTMTFATLPDDLVVGDWVAVAGESPVPQIPREVAPILVYETLIKLLKSLGDWDGAKACEIELEGDNRRPGLKQSVMKIISPRVKGETKFIVSGIRRSSVDW